MTLNGKDILMLRSRSFIEWTLLVIDPRSGSLSDSDSPVNRRRLPQHPRPPTPSSTTPPSTDSPHSCRLLSLIPSDTDGDVEPYKSGSYEDPCHSRHERLHALRPRQPTTHNQGPVCQARRGRGIQAGKRRPQAARPVSGPPPTRKAYKGRAWQACMKL
jgi:hypothetical protein